MYLPEDAVLLMEHMLGLLENNPGLGVLFKPKNNDDRLRRLPEGVYASHLKLRSHPRCMLVGANGPSETAIAASDVVVSACFTSPTLEAICAGKRALYYDPADRLHGYLYESLAGFVAHGPGGLRAALEHWHAMEEATFQGLVSTQIRRVLDPFADGGALRRLRRSIASG